MTLKEVSPQKVLAEVAGAIPAAIHPNVIIIGSLAAGYWRFQRGDETFGVRTKDVDCVLSPHLSAVEKGRAVAETLLKAGWHHATMVSSPNRVTQRRPPIAYLPFGCTRQVAGNGSSNSLLSRRRRPRGSASGLACRCRRAPTTRYRASSSRRWRRSMLSGPNSGSDVLGRK